jgi:heme exporter protein D
VEVEGEVRHHRQDRRTLSREYPSMVSPVWLSYHTVCVSVILITVPVETRRNLSARGNNTQIRRARMRYKRGSGKVGIDGHVKIIKINDRAWQTRGHKTQQVSN